MPRVISEAFPREDTNLGTSHTGTSHKEPTHPHQHTTLDEKQTIFPRGGLKKHHDHHTQRDIEINTWAAQNNAKSHTFIPSEEQSEATTYPFHTNIESGKTFSHKHKFDRELDHRHPKNENTRQLYKWEDEQHRLKQSHGIDAKNKENDMVDKISQSDMDAQDTMTRQGLMDDKTNVQYPSDTISTSDYQRRMERKQKSDERQRLAAEQAERSQRDDVQHPQHAIPEPIISRADTQDDSLEMNRSGSERAMGSGVSGTTVAHNERVNKSESSRM